MPYQAVVFDAYGTLFDVYAMGVLAEKLFPGHGPAISNLWRDKQIEYTRLITLSDPHTVSGSRYYQPFWELTRLSLRHTLARLGLRASADQEDALMAQYKHLPAFEENLGVLRALKQRGIQTAILSNASPDMLHAAVAHAGMTECLDHVLSVDGIRQFKTAPASYGLVAQALPALALNNILFVSSNAWDVLGATWFGLNTLWVNRQDLPPEAIGPAPTHVGTNLKAVLSLV